MQKPKLKTWKKGLLIFFLFPLLFYNLNSCNPAEPEPPPPKPPGYQEDIPWPSLADSPWPMYRADPQSTCRSKYVGPNLGIVEWEIKDSMYFISPVSLGHDSSFYMAGGKIISELTSLFKFNLDGNIIWQSDFGYSENFQTSSPIIDKNHQVYITSPSKKKLLAFNSNGEKIWELDNLYIRQSGLTIDKEGNLIFISYSPNKLIYSVNEDGDINWTADALDYKGNKLNSLSFDTKGKEILFPVLNKIFCASYNLETHQENWRFGEGSTNQPPIIDCKNNKITLSGNQPDSLDLFYLKYNGETIWNFSLTGIAGANIGIYELALSRRGNIIFSSIGLGSINTEGQLNWYAPYDEGEATSGPITVDADGNIFVQKNSSSVRNKVTISKYNSDGELIWDLVLDSNCVFGYPLVITSDNSLLFRGFNSNYICKIK